MNEQLQQQLDKLPESKTKNMVIASLKEGFSTRDPKLAAACFLTAGMMLSNTAFAAGPTEIFPAANAEELKALIIGLLATIALLGTAYLTVLVGISAFGLIRRVVRG
jgi:hypothetical protein